MILILIALASFSIIAYLFWLESKGRTLTVPMYGKPGTLSNIVYRLLLFTVALASFIFITLYTHGNGVTKKTITTTVLMVALWIFILLSVYVRYRKK